jgi:hypothetical protein
MWSTYAMNYNNSTSKGMCHGTTTRKLFRTFGTKQVRVTSCRVLLLRTPNKMSCTYQIQILSCVKALEDKKKRIRNNVDEAEAGAAVVMCYKCLSTGHTYKRCTATSYACNAPPTGSVGSSATLGPSQAPSGRGRGCGRRTNAGFRWSACNIRAFNFRICNIWTIFVVWTYALYYIVIIELLFVLFCWWLFYSLSIIYANFGRIIFGLWLF